LKTTWIKLLAIGCATHILASGVLAEGQAQQSPAFRIGAGITFSPEYREMLDDLYPDDEIYGGFGWVNLSAGVDIPLSSVFSIIPSATFYFNAVDAESEDDFYFNTMVVPALAAKLKLSDAPDTLFLQGEINYGYASSGSDNIDDIEGGVGYGAAIGYQFDGGIDMSLGYSYIPVDVTYEYGGYWGGDWDKETYNFGGVEFKFSKTFN
jgi:hypothetical protein